MKQYLPNLNYSPQSAQSIHNLNKIFKSFMTINHYNKQTNISLFLLLVLYFN